LALFRAHVPALTAQVTHLVLEVVRLVAPLAHLLLPLFACLRVAHRAVTAEGAVPPKRAKATEVIRVRPAEGTARAEAAEVLIGTAEGSTLRAEGATGTKRAARAKRTTMAERAMTMIAPRAASALAEAGQEDAHAVDPLAQEFLVALKLDGEPIFG